MTSQVFLPWWDSVSSRWTLAPLPCLYLQRRADLAQLSLNSISTDSSFPAEGDSPETASSLIPALQIQLSAPRLSLPTPHPPRLSLPLHPSAHSCRFYLVFPCATVHSDASADREITLPPPIVFTSSHCKAIYDFRNALVLKVLLWLSNNCFLMMYLCFASNSIHKTFIKLWRSSLLYCNLFI